VTPVIVFAGLVGAIIWNLLTWLFGLPSSSSHALFGGLIGATWIASGADAVHFGSVVSKILIPALASPLVAGLVAVVGTFLVYKITASARQDVVGKTFKTALSAAGSSVRASDAGSPRCAGASPAGWRSPGWSRFPRRASSARSRRRSPAAAASARSWSAWPG
jgi:phosphate/sulfate permease